MVFFRLTGKYRFGMHVPFRHTIYSTLINGTSSLVKTCQFYMTGNVNYRTTFCTDEDKSVSLSYCDSTNTTFYVHSPLVINLANPQMNEGAFICMKTILKNIEGLPGGMVVHVGKSLRLTPGEGLSVVAQNIASLCVRKGTHSKMPKQFLLECGAGQGTEIGKTWDELRLLYEHLDRDVIGICLDTQHMFASGMCDFANTSSIDKIFEYAEDVSPSALKVFHLNDSMTYYMSCVDRHENLMRGNIWGSRCETLLYLLDQCESRQIDIILETPDPSSDLAILTDLRQVN